MLQAQCSLHLCNNTRVSTAAMLLFPLTLAALLLLPVGAPQQEGAMPRGSKDAVDPVDTPADCKPPGDPTLEDMFKCMNERFTVLKSNLRLSVTLQESNGALLEKQGKLLDEHVHVNEAPQLGSFENPAAACRYLSPESDSKMYWIRNATTGHPSYEYCDMDNLRCGDTGWMRVAFLNMSDESHYCPSGFRYALGSGYRGCGTFGSERRSGTCISATFSVHNLPYSKIYGRVNAYQYHSPEAFGPFFYRAATSIDSSYVNGVSLTHGRSPRQHIWSFAAASDETRADAISCRCIRNNNLPAVSVPPFVGNDYFCDTGSRKFRKNRVYFEDPLWDGHGCGPINTCCEFNKPPWFCKSLPQPTSDDIELRVCVNERQWNEDVILKLVEIYVR